MARSSKGVSQDNAFADSSAVIARAEPSAATLTLIMHRTCDLLEVQQAALFLAEGPGFALRLSAASGGLPETPVLRPTGVSVEGCRVSAALATSRWPPVARCSRCSSPTTQCESLTPMRSPFCPVRRRLVSNRCWSRAKVAASASFS